MCLEVLYIKKKFPGPLFVCVRWNLGYNNLQKRKVWSKMKRWSNLTGLKDWWRRVFIFLAMRGVLGLLWETLVSGTASFSRHFLRGRCTGEEGPETSFSREEYLSSELLLWFLWPRLSLVLAFSSKFLTESNLRWVLGVFCVTSMRTVVSASSGVGLVTWNISLLSSRSFVVSASYNQGDFLVKKKYEKFS